MNAQVTKTPAVVAANNEEAMELLQTTHIKWTSSNVHRALDEVHVMSEVGVYLKVRLVGHEVRPAVMQVTVYGEDSNIFTERKPDYEVSLEEWLYHSDEVDEFHFNINNAFKTEEVLELIGNHEYWTLVNWVSEHPVDTNHTIGVNVDERNFSSYVVDYINDEGERIVSHFNWVLCKYLAKMPWSIMEDGVKPLFKEIITKGDVPGWVKWEWIQNMRNNNAIRTLTDCMVDVYKMEKPPVAKLNDTNTCITLEDANLEYKVAVTDHTDSWYITTTHHVVGGDLIWYFHIDKDILENTLKPEMTSVKWLLDDVIQPLNSDLLQVK